jgi:hypothetical protein
MATALKTLGQAKIQTTISTIYTVPANTTSILKEILMCNSLATSVVFSLYFVLPGDTAGIENCILSNNPLTAYESQVFTLSTFLNAGSSIQMQCDTLDSMGVTISGVEMS